MPEELLVSPPGSEGVAPTVTAPAATEEPVHSVSPVRWMVQLGAAGLGVCAVSLGLFYATARGVIHRGDGPVAAVATPRVDPMAHVVSLERGLGLYAAQCASCHGPQGLGDGPQAEALTPRPRNFESGWFKLGSTRSGLPTDDDVARTIRHGMLPAAMPGWPHLSDGEVKSLALAVRHLAIEGRVADKLRRSPGFAREKALELARAALEPGPVIAMPPKPVTIDLARGKVFYESNCAACHDPDGRGKLREDLVDNDENPIAARDFTSGVFKGGGSLDDIAMRIVRGMPGSPMPGNPAIAADDLWSTAAYVKAFGAAGEAGRR